ncbi:MAG: PadR family transcriptional regulator [Candidatus Pacebacteria bacterium]|nr:PadR family transcriptional regulator [Candidatus Paceibacterota bacterium]
MEPIKRFSNSITDGNLWIYILSLAKEVEIKEEDISMLIFEKFGFLPNKLIAKTVLFRLKKEGYASKEKLAGKPSYKTTEKGLKELESMKGFSSDLIQKL